MAEINWSLAVPPNVAETFMGGFNRGQAMRKERDERNALAAYVQNPTDDGAINALAMVDPRMAMQARQQQFQVQDRQAQLQLRQQETADNARKTQQQTMLNVGKLLDGVNDEATYQQRLGAARQMGMDVSNAPPAYDPTWVNETRTIANLFNKDGGATISGLARELQDAGYDLKSPEGQKAMREVISQKYASEYVDPQGNTRRRSALDLGGGGAGVNVPDAAAAELRANPGTAAQFDAIFGAGASARILGNGGPTPQASGTFLGNFAGLSGETVTSTYRNPAHNKRVGGVSNSYHTRRTADGKPMARDSVPPPGMSMAAYAAELRRRNPHLDVINEGDHVHMEPKG